MGHALDSLAATLRGWTPVHVREESGAIDWGIVDETFADAFFEQTVERAMRHPFNLAFARRTPLAALDSVHAAAPAPAPAAFIFHMSRCGSTLITQMLAQLSSTIVVSEAQPLDALLRLRGRGVDDDTLTRWLRALMSALVLPRSREQRLIVKFHAWHVLELQFIARVFPGVPWIFVFREPRDVLHSQVRLPGVEVVPGGIDPAYLALTLETMSALSPAEYGARTLAAFCEAALRSAGLGRAAFVDYASLPEIVAAKLFDVFGLRASGAEVRRMDDVARLDSKNAGTPFRARRAERDPANELDRLAARWLDGPYAALRARALARA